MSDPNLQQPKAKNAVRTPEQIAEFLEKTGFVFEMRMNESFLKAGYDSEINEEFLDLEGNTLREIDIVASKVVNDINIHFVVECKQSMIEKWIFIFHKPLDRYYHALKHLPSAAASAFREKGLFSSFHTLDQSIPLGNNYLSYTIEGDKKGNHVSIDECVHKLPKALVDRASRVEAGRHLFFPIALFSGQIFAVFYKGKLVVEERPFLQYYVSFESEVYRRAREPEPASHAFSMLLMPEWEGLYKSAREEKIRRVTRELSTHYQLDFVSATGLPDYLGLIEKQVAGVQTRDWPLPDQSEKPGKSNVRVRNG
jgi:hypothetical protein